MPKRFPLLALFLAWLLVANASAGTIEVARVPMPQLAPLQWELLRQQVKGQRRDPTETLLFWPIIGYTY